MKVHKWMIMHISLLKVYIKPKFKNKGTMELVQPPLATDFAKSNLLPWVLWI
jgi:hypothetical protein